MTKAIVEITETLKYTITVDVPDSEYIATDNDIKNMAHDIMLDGVLYSGDFKLQVISFDNNVINRSG